MHYHNECTNNHSDIRIVIYTLSRPLSRRLPVNTVKLMPIMFEYTSLYILGQVGKSQQVLVFWDGGGSSREASIYELYLTIICCCSNSTSRAMHLDYFVWSPYHQLK
jgi:hypothetical protein